MKQLVVAFRRRSLVGLSGEMVGSRELAETAWGVRSRSGVEDASRARDRWRKTAASVMASVEYQS